MIRSKTILKNVSFEEFCEDTEKQDAILRRLEIIGEAAKNIPNPFKEEHPEISWKSAAAMRDVLSHEYFGVKPDLVWETIEKDLPILKSSISKLVDD